MIKAFEDAGLPCTRIELTEEQQKAFKKSEREFRKWYEHRNPKNCSCGKKIKEYNLYINDVGKCEDCFHEAIKHGVFI